MGDVALSQVLDGVPIIVRGTVLESFVRGGFTYTRIAVSEVWRGRMPKENQLVRQPGAGEEGTELLRPGEDAVVLLDERDPADGSYPIVDFPAGRYRVSNDGGADFVMVNAMGVDDAFLSAKDKRPRTGSEPMPMEAFVRVVGARADAMSPQRRVSQDSTTPADAAPVPAPDDPSMPARSAAPPPPPTRWGIWGAALLVVAALFAMLLVRRRR